MLSPGPEPVGTQPGAALPQLEPGLDVLQPPAGWIQPRRCARWMNGSRCRCLTRSTGHTLPAIVVILTTKCEPSAVVTARCWYRLHKLLTRPGAAVPAMVTAAPVAVTAWAGAGPEMASSPAAQIRLSWGITCRAAGKGTFLMWREPLPGRPSRTRN